MDTFLRAFKIKSVLLALYVSDICSACMWFSK